MASSAGASAAEGTIIGTSEYDLKVEITKRGNTSNGNALVRIKYTDPPISVVRQELIDEAEGKGYFASKAPTQDQPNRYKVSVPLGFQPDVFYFTLEEDDDD